ncbi:MAG TPA: secretin N-terminal domain-containing protein, partial [Fimbriiglobus sp.]|nr:secretin N-terminal domain-containing protein [Fimbriiglobus sp.]
MRVQHVRRSLQVPLWRLRRWLPAVLVASLGGVVVAQTPPAPPPLAAAAKPAEPEKTFSQKFDKASWDSVLAWFSKATGLQQITTEKPGGTVTVNIDNKSLPDTIDLLNDALAREKWVLIRSDQSFTLHPASDKVPPELIPQIQVDQLPKRGRTEMVQVFIPLKTLSADEIAPQVKQAKLLSNFGDVGPLGTNHIVVQDKVGNIRNIINYLKDLEGGTGVGDTLTYQCKYVSALDAAGDLKTLLADKDTTVQTGQMGQPGFGGFPQPFGGFPQPDFSRRDRDRQSTPSAGPRFKSVQIVVSEGTNTIHITGPADKLAVAKSMLEKMDVGGDGQKRRPVGGSPSTVVYNVPAGTADSYVKILQARYKASQVVQISALPGGSQVMVFAHPADHFDIAAILKGSGETKSNTAVEFVPLTLLDPKTTADSLTKSLGGTSSSGGTGLFVESRTDGSQVGVLLRGTPDQIAEAKTIIAALGEELPTTGPNGTKAPALGGARVITIEKGSAAALAEALAEMMKSMGKAPPTIIVPGGRKEEPATPEKAPTPKPAEPIKTSLAPDRIPVQYVVAQAPAAPEQPKKDAAPPAGPERPPVIVVAGDRLIISGGDPEYREALARMARIILQSGDKAVERYDVIRLKNVTAEDAARTVHEVFNGPPQQNQPQQRGGQQGGRGGFNPLAMLAQFAGAGAQAPNDPTAGRVRVVAEKTSNSLIVVKASPLDMLTIRKLLEKAIDSDAPPEGGVMKTYTIALQYARAVDLLPVVRGVFQNASGASPGGRTNNRRGPGTGTGTAARHPPGGASPENAIALSVEADDVSN